MARYDGAITDSDIHHVWRYDSELLDYLPKQWQDFALAGRPEARTEREVVSGSGYSGRLPMYPPGVTVARSGAHGSRMATSFPEAGGKPGSDYDLLCEQVLIDTTTIARFSPMSLHTRSTLTGPLRSVKRSTTGTSTGGCPSMIVFIAR